MPSFDPKRLAEARKAYAKVRIKTPYSQALELQALVFRDAKAPEISASERASLIRAWIELEDRKRILRNKPLPGSLRPQPTGEKKSKKRGPMQPGQPTQEDNASVGNQEEQTVAEKLDAVKDIS